jgi:uncharacterized protein YecT (DUF1311 family)
VLQKQRKLRKYIKNTIGKQQKKKKKKQIAATTNAWIEVRDSHTEECDPRIGV